MSSGVFKTITDSNTNLTEEWLNEVVGKYKLQIFQDNFAEMFNISLCFLDLNGKPLTIWSKPSLFCTGIYQYNKERCVKERKTAIKRIMLNNQTQRYSCFMGIECFVVPVRYKKNIIAVAIGALQDKRVSLNSRLEENDIEKMCELLTASVNLTSSNKSEEGHKEQQMLLGDSAAFLLQRNITRRELDVITMVAKGKTNKEISSELNVSEATVKTHLTNILKKVQLHDRIELILYVKQNGLEF